jgi:glycosyltransferase involved in cell wall biosynthesis
MTKVLHIITDSNIGGAGHQMLTLIDTLSGDFTAEVILPQNSRLGPALERRKIKYYELPHIAERSFSWAGVGVIRKKLKEILPDIVHTHASLAGRIAARLHRKCKIVHTLHCAFPVEKWRKSFPMKQISGCVNNMFSDRMIATSPVARDTLLQMGASQKKIRVIFNGVPPAEEFPTEKIARLREKFNIPQNNFVVAYIARLTEIKGHDYVFDTAREQPYNVILIFAGDGDYEEHLKQRVENENLNNVRMLGFVENVDEVLAVTDVQINASYVSETTSLSLLQGMSVGKPAIVTNFGGNPFVIKDGENGLLIPVCDPQAMDDAITKLRDDKDLYEQLSIGARLRYSKHFTAKKMTEDTESVYKELLK